jgi:pseudaminic acid cytidylyltransferase
MSNLAIIPARIGSKRIPQKNIKNFLGIPIIKYSINAAINSNLFDEVMVSTDDNQIAAIAIESGATVPFFRSELNSNDTATTKDVIEEVLSQYIKLDKYFDNTCCIYPCAPFCTSENLQISFNSLINNNFYTVFPIVKYSSPIQRSLILRGSRVVMKNLDFLNTRSQDVEEFYYDAGQFYWIRNSKKCQISKIYSDNSGYIILDELNAQDIDTQIDWELAELKYKLKNKL